MKTYSLFESDSKKFIGLGVGEDLVEGIVGAALVAPMLGTNRFFLKQNKEKGEEDNSRTAILYINKTGIQCDLILGEHQDIVKEKLENINKEGGHFLLLCTPDFACVSETLSTIPCNIEPMLRHKLSLVGIV